MYLFIFPHVYIEAMEHWFHASDTLSPYPNIIQKLEIDDVFGPALQL